MLGFSSAVRGWWRCAALGAVVVASLPLSAGTVTLSWIDNSDDEDGFVVQRRSVAGSFADIAVLKANSTYFADVGLSAGSTYFYRVASFNQVGRSRYTQGIGTTVVTESAQAIEPVIAPVADRTFALGQLGGVLSLTVSNGAGPLDSLVVTVTSSNPDLIPNESLILAGLGTVRTLTLIPNPGRTGVAVITVVVSNSSKSTSSSFAVAVGTDLKSESSDRTGDQLYFGTLGSAGERGRFGLLLKPDGTGVFVADGQDFPLGLAVFPISLGGQGEFSVEVSGVGTVRGVATRGTLSGAMGPKAVPFRGVLDNPAGGDTAAQGLYRGAIAGTVDDTFLALIGPSGKAIVASTLNGFVQSCDADFSSPSAWTGGETGGSQYSLEWNRATGTLVGTRTTSQGVRRVGARLEGRASVERIVNISVRGVLQSGGDSLVAGFTVGGGGTRPLVIRAVGPTLAQFGVPAVLPDPLLEIYRQGSIEPSPMVVNDSWNERVLPQAASYGGFPLLSGSADAAIFANLPVGSYTARVGAGNAGTGQVLVELYDADQAGAFGAARLSNISLLTRLSAEDSRVIGGFSMSGDVPRRLLVRAVGPELSRFGVTGTQQDPVLELYGSDGTRIAVVDDAPVETPRLAELSARTGAFPLAVATKSSAYLVWVAPGTYTAHIKSASSAPGVVLLEIYEVP